MSRYNVQVVYGQKPEKDRSLYNKYLLLIGGIEQNPGRRQPKVLRAIRGYFGPPLRRKIKIAFHQFLLNWFIRAMAQVWKSGANFTLPLLW